jgi:hypothetical protein
MVNIAAVERARTHLELAIDLDSDPISGSISNGTHGSQPFSGWIELVAAIEAARISADPLAGLGEAGTQTLGSLPGAKATGL